MGWFTTVMKGISGAVHGIEDVPVVGKGLKALPGVGNVLSAVDLGMNAYQLLSPENSTQNGMPSLQTGGMGGLPQLPGMTGMSVQGGVPNEKYMTIGERPAMIPPTSPLLRTYHRAPKGYTIVHALVNGQVVAYALRDDVAKAQGHHKRHHHKPPISVGQWHALKKAHTTVKKIERVNKMARHILGAGSRMHVKPHHHQLPAPGKRK